MATDQEQYELLQRLVSELPPGTTGSELLDEADRRLGVSVSGRALMYFVIDRTSGGIRLGYRLLGARYRRADRAEVDELMAIVLAGGGGDRDD